MSLIWDDKREVWLRPGTYDHGVAREVNTYKDLAPSLGGYLLDIGGNIGAVARWWLLNGGSRVTTVEPEPDNLRVLRANIEQFGDAVTVVPAAAVPDDAPAQMPLYLNNGTNKGAHTLRPTRGRDPVLVNTVRFSELLATRPDALKVDIEAGEYPLIPYLLNLPDSVRRFAIEWHLQPRGAREKAREADAALLAQGWEALKGNLTGDKTWHTVRSYVR